MRISVGINTSLLIACVVVTTAPALAGGKVAYGHLEAFQELMKQIVQADGQLCEQMQYVSKRLQQYYARNGRFPSPGTAEQNFKTSVLRHFPFNPYRPKVTDLYYDKQLPEEEKTHLHILTDPFMNYDSVRAFRKSPPTSWRAEPGTIMVITNGEGTYAIWGASADRQPVRDYANNNRVRLLGRDLAADALKRQFASTPQAY